MECGRSETPQQYRCGCIHHVDNLDFLADYPRARIEAFLPQNIQNSFAATGFTPFNPERVLF
jgi:hypothetical protein